MRNLSTVRSRRRATRCPRSSGHGEGDRASNHFVRGRAALLPGPVDVASPKVVHRQVEQSAVSGCGVRFGEVPDLRGRRARSNSHASSTAPRSGLLMPSTRAPNRMPVGAPSETDPGIPATVAAGAPSTSSLTLSSSRVSATWCQAPSERTRRAPSRIGVRRRCPTVRGADPDGLLPDPPIRFSRGPRVRAQTIAWCSDELVRNQLRSRIGTGLANRSL